MTLAQLLKDVQISGVKLPGMDRETAWTDERAQALAAREIGAVTERIEDVRPSDLHICLCRDRAQARERLAQAEKRGASLALVESFCAADIPQLLCGDIRAAAARVYANFHGDPQRKLKMIGVTGTNGKTTVATLIRHILQSCGKTCGLIGTNGDAVGAPVRRTGYTTPIPRILFAELAEAAERGCEYVVMEVSSHALDQKRVEPIRFELAVFTNLTRDHLDYHGSMDAYLNAKKRLFARAAKSVVNTDDGAGYAIMESCAGPGVAYGCRPGAAYLAQGVSLGRDGVSYTLVYRNEERAVTFPVPGMFSVYNSLAAVACCHELGLPLPQVLSAAGSFGGVRGRMETVETGLAFQVVIDYAHTPDGLENVLRTIRGYKKGRLILVFGCGGDRDRGKRPQMCRVAAALADYIVITSDNPRGENPYAIIGDILSGMAGFETPFAVIENRRAATKFALEQARAGDVVLLAGKGHENYQIVGDTVYPYDETEIVRELIGNLRE